MKRLSNTDLVCVGEKKLQSEKADTIIRYIVIEKWRGLHSVSCSNGPSGPPTGTLGDQTEKVHKSGLACDTILVSPS